MHDDILSRSWFVVAATPGREHDAAEVLRGHQAVVFQPLEHHRHKPNHHSKRRWHFWRPLMGRYMLAGFAVPTPPWFSLLEYTSIAQVIDYRPVRRQTVLELIVTHGSQSIEPPPRRRARTSTEEITAGCDAVVLSGPYFGRAAKVHEIIPTRNGKPRASVLLPFLNSDRLVELPLEDLEREAA